MNIEGKKVLIAKSSKEAYNFFMTLENFELLEKIDNSIVQNLR